MVFLTARKSKDGLGLQKNRKVATMRPSLIPVISTRRIPFLLILTVIEIAIIMNTSLPVLFQETQIRTKMVYWMVLSQVRVQYIILHFSNQIPIRMDYLTG